MNRLDGMVIGLSGSVPSRDERAKYGCSDFDIHQVVQQLVTEIFAQGGRITFGAHPTFVPIIERVASSMPGPRRDALVRMFVARRFFDHPSQVEDYEARHRSYCTLAWIGEHDTPRKPALDELRRKMIDQAEALVCVGGLLHEDEPDVEPGVKQELEFALAKQIPIYLLGCFYGYTRWIYEDRFAADPSPLRNHLSPEENHVLGTQADVWTSVPLVLKGLAAVRTHAR